MVYLGGGETNPREVSKKALVRFIHVVVAGTAGIFEGEA